MKINYLISIILFLLVTIACSQTNPENEITAEELNKMLQEKKNLVIVDVAEPDEYKAARLKGAVNIPIMSLKANFENKLPQAEKDDEIILYCYSGMRSAIGVEKLKELGYTNVLSLKGGVSNWKRKGYPVNSGD